MPSTFLAVPKSRRMQCLVALAAFLAIASPPARGQQSDRAAVSAADRASLFPVVYPGLKPAVVTLDNSPVTRQDVADEYKNCRFSHVDLGALGLAVVVEWNPMSAPNANFIGVYIRRLGAWHKLVVNSGFGPTIISGPQPIPDLVFGGNGGGVCQSEYFRFRYAHGTYRPNACNQEKRGSGEGCQIVSCGNGLPTFPDPWRDTN